MLKVGTVRVDGTRLILGAYVAESSADNRELEPALETVLPEAGTQATVLDDAGYGRSIRRWSVDEVPDSVSLRYTLVVNRTDLGRRLREKNLRALSPERRIRADYIELSSLLALTPDGGWSEFVRRWRRRGS